jgi:hypothetical protein
VCTCLCCPLFRLDRRHQPGRHHYHECLLGFLLRRSSHTAGSHISKYLPGPQSAGNKDGHVVGDFGFLKSDRPTNSGGASQDQSAASEWETTGFKVSGTADFLRLYLDGWGMLDCGSVGSDYKEKYILQITLPGRPMYHTHVTYLKCVIPNLV